MGTSDAWFENGTTHRRCLDCSGIVRGGPTRCEQCAASVVAEAVLADAVRTQPKRTALPEDSSERKRTPLITGVVDYFAGALMLLAYAQPLDPDAEHDHEAAILCVLQRRPVEPDHGAETWAYVELMQHSLAILHRELTGEPPPRYESSLWGLIHAYAEEFALVAQGSWFGNEKHNPGQPLHHSRGKSADHADCIARHVLDNAADPGGYEKVLRADGSLIGEVRHATWLVWRSFAITQEALELRGAPKARGAK